MFGLSRMGTIIIGAFALVVALCAGWLGWVWFTHPEAREVIALSFGAALLTSLIVSAAGGRR